MIHTFCLFSFMNFIVWVGVYSIAWAIFKKANSNDDFEPPACLFFYFISSILSAFLYNQMYLFDFDHQREINHGRINVEEYLPIVSSKSKSDLIDGSKYTVKLNVYSFYNSSEINVSKEKYDLLQIGSIYTNNVSSSTNYVVPINGVTPQKK